MIVRVRIVSQQPQVLPGGVRVDLEEIDWVRAGLGKAQPPARLEAAAEHPAQVGRASGQLTGEPARLSLVEKVNEATVSKALVGRKSLSRFSFPSGGESRFENRQMYQSIHPITKCKTVDSQFLVDLEVPLCVLELVQEPILEDVHLVQIVAVPEMRSLVPHVARLDHGVPAQFALDAEVPLLNVRRAQVRLHRAEADVAECEIGLAERWGETRRGSHKRRKASTQAQAADREVGPRSQRLSLEQPRTL